MRYSVMALTVLEKVWDKGTHCHAGIHGGEVNITWGETTFTGIVVDEVSGILKRPNSNQAYTSVFSARAALKMGLVCSSLSGRKSLDFRRPLILLQSPPLPGTSITKLGRTM